MTSQCKHSDPRYYAQRKQTSEEFFRAFTCELFRKNDAINSHATVIRERTAISECRTSRVSEVRSTRDAAEGSRIESGFRLFVVFDSLATLYIMDFRFHVQ